MEVERLAENLITVMKGAGLPATVVFPVVGFEGTFTDNAMLLLEDRTAQVIAWLGLGNDPEPQ